MPEWLDQWLWKNIRLYRRYQMRKCGQQFVDESRMRLTQMEIERVQERQCPGAGPYALDGPCVFCGSRHRPEWRA